MKGRYYLSVSDTKIKYDISLDRKVTILKGKSGTGKSSLIRMLEEHQEFKRSSGIHLVSNLKIKLLKSSTDWAKELSECSNCLFVGDEYLQYLTYQDFGEAVNNSDNYFLFITRSGRLSNLTYAVGSIYEISCNRSEGLSVNSLYKRYFNELKTVKPDLIITEDSNSGFEMMSLLCRGSNINVVSAGGKDNIINKVLDNYDKRLVVFADLSAFGSSIAKFDSVLNNITILNIESFEYLLLSLSFLNKFVQDELNDTALYCDYNSEIISWERYYTKLLDFVLRNNLFVSHGYSKSRLISLFKNDSVYSELKTLLNDIIWD